MREEDARKIIEFARGRFKSLSPTPPKVWDAAPPVWVIDCVLSLNRRYKEVVAPRVVAFEAANPGIRTCEQLLSMIRECESPAAFTAQHLSTNDPARAVTLVGVLEFVIDTLAAYPGGDEAERLAAWADDARPGDYLAVGVRGFALAGFQYLRMLFGANTTKPDRHIVNWVSEAVGREVTDVQALYAIERAAELGGFSAAWLDGMIWKAATSHSSSPPSGQ